MRARVFLGLLALPLVACLDAGAEGTVDDGYHGTLRIVVAPLNLEDVDAVLFDVAAGPDGGDAGWTRERVQWTRENDTVALVVPCDVRDNPFRAEVHAVGIYEVVQADFGGFDEVLPPEGVDYQDPGVIQRDASCVAGEETLVYFDIALMKPAKQGYFDMAFNLDAGPVGDAVWDLRTLNADTPPETYWQQRIASSEYGDSAGSASYVGPCDAQEEGAVNGQEIRLVGLYADDVERPNSFGEPGPDVEALELWPLPLIVQAVTCYERVDRFVQYDITVARVVRAHDTVRARFDDVTCEASWTCATAPTLELACTSTGEAAPSLHLDDLVVRCGGTEVARIAPEALGGVSFERLDSGRPLSRWRVVPTLDPSLLGAAACVLEAGATVNLPAPHTLPPPYEPSEQYPEPIEPMVQLVYPRITWAVPVSDAGDPRCDDAALDLDGPVTVTYTSADAFVGTHYDHVVDPQESP